MNALAFCFIDTLLLRASVVVDSCDAQKPRSDVDARHWLVRGIPARWFADVRTLKHDLMRVTADWSAADSATWQRRSDGLGVSSVRPGRTLDIATSFTLPQDWPSRVILVGHWDGGWLLSIDGVEGETQRRKHVGAAMVGLYFGPPASLQKIARRQVKAGVEGLLLQARTLARTIPADWWPAELAAMFSKEASASSRQGRRRVGAE